MTPGPKVAASAPGPAYPSSPGRHHLAQALAVSPSFGFQADRVQIQGPAAVPHLHGDLELNLMVQGAVSYLVSGTMHRLEAGELVALWAALPHGVLAAEPSSVMIWVTIPLVRLVHWGLSERFLRRMWQGALVGDGGSGSDDLGLMTRWVEDLRQGQDELKAIVALEVEARVRRLARTCARARSLDARDAASSIGLGEASLARVQDMVAHLGRSYREPVTWTDVARTAGLHQNYAMVVFRRVCGMTMHAYLTHLRLAHAQRLLVSTDRTILAIALDAGFGSLTRCYAAFHDHCRCSPGIYRRKARSGVPDAAGSGHLTAGRRRGAPGPGRPRDRKA